MITIWLRRMYYYMYCYGEESSYLFVYGTLVILYLENQRKCHFYCLKLLFLSFKNVVFSEDCFGTKHVTTISDTTFLKRKNRENLDQHDWLIRCREFFNWTLANYIIRLYNYFLVSNKDKCYLSFNCLEEWKVMHWAF